MSPSSPANRNGVAPSAVPSSSAATGARVRNPIWLTAAEVALALDCSERSVWKWSGENVIPAPVRRGRKFTRWKRAEIEQYLAGTWVPPKAK